LAEEIAGLEDISRERVRQIVVKALKERQADRTLDRGLLAEVRLGPALRLAAKAVVEGKLEGVDRLLKVIDRLEKLQGPTPRRVYDENARAKLLAKLSRPSSSLEARRAGEATKASLEPTGSASRHTRANIDPRS
jgi:hypothetical protein